MAKKRNLAIREEVNEIELEIASYLINLDELIYEKLGDNGRFTEPLHMDEIEDLDLVQSINSPMEYSHHSGFW
jgi:hypothetical protein